MNVIKTRRPILHLTEKGAKPLQNFLNWLVFKFFLEFFFGFFVGIMTFQTDFSYEFHSRLNSRRYFSSSMDIFHVK